MQKLFKTILKTKDQFETEAMSHSSSLSCERILYKREGEILNPGLFATCTLQRFTCVLQIPKSHNIQAFNESVSSIWFAT